MGGNELWWQEKLRRVFAMLGQLATGLSGTFAGVSVRMARAKLNQEVRWREELHADDLSAGRKVARIQGDNAVGAGGKSRRQDRLIIDPLQPDSLPPRLKSLPAPAIGAPGSRSRLPRSSES